MKRRDFEAFAAVNKLLFPLGTLLVLMWVGTTSPAVATVDAGADLPPAVRRIAAGLNVHSEAEARWLGLSVYRARLWTTPGGWRADRPSALEIRYAMAIRGEQLATRSAVEMRHIGAGSEAQRSDWLRSMQRIFPDVKDGDRLTALWVPGGPMRFYFNAAPAGEVDDAEFGPAFLGIWLSPSTSRPDLRRQLLRGAE